MNFELAGRAGDKFHFPGFFDNLVARRKRDGASARYEQKREREKSCSKRTRMSAAASVVIPNPRALCGVRDLLFALEGRSIEDVNRPSAIQDAEILPDWKLEKGEEKNGHRD
jgi:hypothetical protein